VLQHRLVFVKRLNAANAARRFSDVLDAIESVGSASGKLVKDILCSNSRDRRRASELRELRAGLVA
jgi:hypothetical protein